jgi:hypothetical protein
VVLSFRRGGFECFIVAHHFSQCFYVCKVVRIFTFGEGSFELSFHYCYIDFYQIRDFLVSEVIFAGEFGISFDFLTLCLTI